MTRPVPRATAAAPALPQVSPVPSPCVGLCRIDAASGLCLGCARTVDEIGAWTGSPGLRLRAWAELPARRDALGLGFHRLAWTSTELRAFVECTFRSAGGHWSPGAFSGFAAYRVRADERPTYSHPGPRLLATGPHAAMLVCLDDRVRALAFDRGAAVGTVVLAGTADRRETAGVVRPLGPDLEALAPGASSQMLFDLGVGGPSGTLALRTGDARAIASLDRLAGLRWSDLPASVRGTVLASSSTRVLRHPLGRFEARGRCTLTEDGDAAGSEAAGLGVSASAGPEWSLPDLPGCVPCAVYRPPGAPRCEGEVRP